MTRIGEARSFSHDIKKPSFGFSVHLKKFALLGVCLGLIGCTASQDAELNLAPTPHDRSPEALKDTSCPQNALDPLAFQTFLGVPDLRHPLLKALAVHPLLQRLKAVDQSGQGTYFGTQTKWGKLPYYSRFSHALGVLILLQRFKAPLKEQCAGLLHDVSHTAFSHTGDFLDLSSRELKNAYSEALHAYQDTVHLQVLKAEGIEKVIAPYGLTLTDLDPDKASYKRQEQPLPDICADRLEYNLHTGLLFGLINAQDVEAILQALRFEDGRWYFVCPGEAKKFADLSVHFTRHFWGAPWSMVSNRYFAEILRYALEKGIVSREMVLRGTDTVLFQIFQESPDPYIQERFKKCQHIGKSFTLAHEGEPFDVAFFPKCRAIDPWVRVEKSKGVWGFERLSALDSSFKKALESLKAWCQKGCRVRFRPLP